MTFIFGQRPQTEAEQIHGGVTIIVNAIEDIARGERPTGRHIPGVSGALFVAPIAADAVAVAVAQQRSIAEREAARRAQLVAGQPRMQDADP